MQKPLSEPSNAHKFRTTFENILKSEVFLTEGGYLGFPLSHEYPIPLKPNDMSFITFLEHCLKGQDFLVYQTCRDFGLDVSVKLYYNAPAGCDGEDVLGDHELLKHGELYILDEEDSTAELLVRHGGLKIRDEHEVFDAKKRGDPVPEGLSLFWITKRPDLNRVVRSTCLFYGNEYSGNFIYGCGCLVVKIGLPENRSCAS